jgi:hypothetical protein
MSEIERVGTLLLEPTRSRAQPLNFETAGVVYSFATRRVTDAIEDNCALTFLICSTCSFSAACKASISFCCSLIVNSCS